MVSHCEQSQSVETLRVSADQERNQKAVVGQKLNTSSNDTRTRKTTTQEAAQC